MFSRLTGVVRSW